MTLTDEDFDSRSEAWLDATYEAKREREREEAWDASRPKERCGACGAAADRFSPVDEDDLAAGWECGECPYATLSDGMVWCYGHEAAAAECLAGVDPAEIFAALTDAWGATGEEASRPFTPFTYGKLLRNLHRSLVLGSARYGKPRLTARDVGVA